MQTPALYLDQRTILLGGWPGHRIRPGRSGYDPLDAYFEEAHIEGVLLRSLFTGRCLTNNFFYLLLMTLFGFMAVSPLLLIIADLKSVDPFLLAVVSPYVVVGLVVLANVFISLASLSDEETKFITGP